jgi:hypothetical protein
MNIIKIVATMAAGLLISILAACAPSPTSNDMQRDRQNEILNEAVAEVGLPAITNFREFKIYKMIYELRDQEGLVTYTYAENITPLVVPGFTVQGGKYTVFCDSVGYPISAATQFTAPETMQTYNLAGTAGSQRYYGIESLPQAEPNGLFMPSSTEGSWVICKNPGKDEVGVVYSEPRLVAFPYQLPLDTAVE